jgi:hypothetical protein
MSTCNQLGLEPLGSWPTMPKNFLGTKGRFKPRGRAKLLCKRLEILTCDWPKGSNRSQPLYTYRLGRFGGMLFLIKKCMLWPGLSSFNWVHQKWRTNYWSRG